jgi:hypothetical protein
MPKKLTRPQLDTDQIIVGRKYRAKRPARNWLSGEIENDRIVLWIDSERSTVQYDSHTVGLGRHYPKVTMEKFIKWASHDVTSDPKA